MSKRKMRMVGKFIAIILNSASGEVMKKAIDAFLDVIEDNVKETSKKIDDIIVLPLCKLVRKILDVPDDDDE